MKSYTYTAQECGLKELPPGELRLSGFTRTNNPQDADVFIVPCDLRNVSNAQLMRLPYLPGNAERHAMFAISEQPKRFIGLPSIIFRADCTKDVLRSDPTTLAWPWPVEDYETWTRVPEEGFAHDVCFVGWNSTPLTAQVCKSVVDTPTLKSFIQLNDTFYGTWESQGDKEKTTYYRRLFLCKMQKSRLSLCARSKPEGVVRYRFYEAMSCARIPVHFCDNAVLPFGDKIDWDKCSVSIPEAQAVNAGALIQSWLHMHADADIIERGKYGRQMWETWLNGANWDALFAYCVKERLGVNA